MKISVSGCELSVVSTLKENAVFLLLNSEDCVSDSKYIVAKRIGTKSGLNPSDQEQKFYESIGESWKQWIPRCYGLSDCKEFLLLEYCLRLSTGEGQYNSILYGEYSKTILEYHRFSKKLISVDVFGGKSIFWPNDVDEFGFLKSFEVLLLSFIRRYKQEIGRGSMKVIYNTLDLALWKFVCGEYGARVVLHGDLRSDNIIISNHVKFIDWEAVSIGHPLIDVVCLLGQSVDDKDIYRSALWLVGELGERQLESIRLAYVLCFLYLINLDLHGKGNKDAELLRIILRRMNLLGESLFKISRES